ncbi:MAG: hypothetical protein HYU31_17195, partial [Deltaproteobacteria bacterium]|nr:hypothetical protein [Deltaproteobacteria bacterium]
AMDASLAAVTAVVGAVLLGMALTGYFVREIGWLKRVLLVVASLNLLTPATGKGVIFTWITDVVGITLAAAVLASEVWGGFRFRHAFGESLTKPEAALDHNPPEVKNPQQ